MFEYQLLIPKKRVGVLIGDKGKTKRLIERLTKTKLTINDEEVTISSEDSYSAWIAEKVVKAIGRGFNPKYALKLIKDDYVLELINIMDYARNQNDKPRLKGRVIGDKGRTKNQIEHLTKTKLVIFGKTIGVIGSSVGVQSAVEAIKMILSGSQIGTAIKFLEQQIKSRVKKELL